MGRSKFVVGEFDDAVVVAGFGQVAGNGVVFEAGAADAFVFALSVFGGTLCGFVFDQLAEGMLRFEMVDVPSLWTLFQTAFVITFGRIRSVEPVVRRHRSRRR